MNEQEQGASYTPTVRDALGAINVVADDVTELQKRIEYLELKFAEMIERAEAKPS